MQLYLPIIFNLNSTYWYIILFDLKSVVKIEILRSNQNLGMVRYWNQNPTESQPDALLKTKFGWAL